MGRTGKRGKRWEGGDEKKEMGSKGNDDEGNISEGELSQKN